MEEAQRGVAEADEEMQKIRLRRWLQHNPMEIPPTWTHVWGPTWMRIRNNREFPI